MLVRFQPSQPKKERIMIEITDRCFLRPRVYKGSLSVNIFYGDTYLGSIRTGGKIDRESCSVEGFVIEEDHGLFKVFKK